MRQPALPDGRQLVDRVLVHLDHMKRLATYRNDRRAVLHFNECWAVVYAAFYGGYDLPRSLAVTATQPAVHVVPATRPQWFIDKYSRPVRKVIARVQERVQQRRRLPPVVIHHDVLECGHKQKSLAPLCGANPAKYRRCKQCQQQRLCNTTTIKPPVYGRSDSMARGKR